MLSNVFLLKYKGHNYDQNLLSYINENIILLKCFECNVYLYVFLYIHYTHFISLCINSIY